MIEKIRKFFKNKKAEAAFKRAGPGYKLDDASSQCLTPSISGGGGGSTSSSSSSGSSKSSRKADCQYVSQRSGLTEESQQAAAAALARLDKQKHNGNFNRSHAAIKAAVRQEMEAEKLKEKNCASGKSHGRNIPEIELQSSPMLAVQGVYFQCPLIGPDILTKEEWNQKIRSFLYEQLQEEKGLVACLIIHTLNRSKEKIDACIDTIIKYFENILRYPTDEKYQKIRMGNRIFEERVKPIEGALLLLEAAGFEVKELQHQDARENFLVYPVEKLAEAREIFEMLIDGLKNAEPITLELHRNLQVLLPSQIEERNELPPSFFQLTVEEIRREQLLRKEAVEKNQMLRTKAMREKDEIQEIRKYKFALMRIRFPDNVYLQGTFGVHEKISSVFEFVRDALDDENLKFALIAPDGRHLMENSESTLADFKLVPAVILTFAAETSRQSPYLKPEVLLLLESLAVS